MGRWSRSNLTLGSLGIGLVLFFGINILASAALRSWRLDLTEENLYTLSKGSQNIAASLEEPIRLTLFFSEEPATDVPALSNYATRVRELLEEYVLHGGGKIELEVLDPKPFSDEEDQAVEAGIAGIPSGGPGSDRIYFGLLARNAVDDHEVIPFFDPSEERFLEYEVSRILYSLAHPQKKVVGILSSLPLEGSGPSSNPFQPQPSSPPWQIIRQIRKLFEVRSLDSLTGAIPEDVDILLVVHPKALSDETLFAIDQFVLEGGKALVFVDPHCEVDEPPSDPQNPLSGMTAPRSSNLDRLFSSWGIEMIPDRVVADRSYAQRVRVGGASRPEVVDYVLWLGLHDDAIDREDPVTSSLQRLQLATSGALRARDDATTTFEPLLRSSKDAMLLDVEKVRFFPDPKKLLGEFTSEDTSYVLAARVSGAAKTAFPEGRPGETKDEDGGAASADSAKTLHESAGPIQVIVCADADLLRDDLWIHEEKLFGQLSLGATKLADNGDLVLQALDNLCGSEDLIGIRARGRFTRPFDRVEEIRRNAEQRYLAEEQRLQQKLQETEQKLNELQASKEGGNQLVLSPEQQDELKRFREEQVKTRKQLREVQHGLRSEIEALGTRLKIVNIALLPIVVSAAAVGFGIWRVGRRRRS